MKKITLITASWCAPCKATKEWFANMQLDGVTTQIIDVDDALESLPPIVSVPTFCIENGDQRMQVSGTQNQQSLINILESLGT